MYIKHPPLEKAYNKTLFTIEKELDPVSVIFWYKIIKEVENIYDRSENMAERLLLFFYKYRKREKNGRH